MSELPEQLRQLTDRAEWVTRSPGWRSRVLRAADEIKRLERELAEEQIKRAETAVIVGRLSAAYESLGGQLQGSVCIHCGAKGSLSNLELPASNDLVQRLRDYDRTFGWGICRDAADEIERLTKERDYWERAQATLCRVELDLRACIKGLLNSRAAEPNDMLKSLLYSYDLWPPDEAPPAKDEVLEAVRAGRVTYPPEVLPTGRWMPADETTEKIPPDWHGGWM